MDFHSDTPQQNDRHSARMESLSVFLGAASLFTICFVYPSIICGALGIVFALLSRGGETHLSKRAKTGLILSASALVIIVLMFVYTFVFANVYYGGIENMLRESCKMLGLDYNALFSSIK